MFQFQPDAQYMMPAHFGNPIVKRDSLLCGDVTTLSITYLTDRHLLAQYLPAPLEVGPEALVTVAYARNRNVAWLGGRSYNVMGVNVSAVFRGQVDQVAGDYCLVLWENLTDGILMGREIQGMPKIYADIADPVVTRGVWTAAASHWGKKMVDIALWDLQALTGPPLEELQGLVHHTNWMGWKYIPKTGMGEPGADVNHATLCPITATIDRAWVGQGQVQWHQLTWLQNPTQFHIANTLATLPILEYRLVFISEGSTDLVVPGQPVRPLH